MTLDISDEEKEFERLCELKKKNTPMEEKSPVQIMLDKMKAERDSIPELVRTIPARSCEFCGKEEILSNYEYRNIEQNGYSNPLKCSCEGYINKLYIAWKEKQNERISNLFPNKFCEKTFDNYKGNEEVVKALKKLANNGWESVLLSGGVGCGKTHLAFSFARESMVSMTKVHVDRYHKDNYGDSSALTCNLPKFTLTTISEMLSSIIDKAHTMLEYKNSHMLIIDDLGVESSKEWASEKVFELINHRYNEELTTVITTNLNSKELKLAVGDRTFSRITEMCTTFKLIGSDYRIKNIKKQNEYTK